MDKLNYFPIQLLTGEFSEPPTFEHYMFRGPAVAWDGENLYDPIFIDSPYEMAKRLKEFGNDFVYATGQLEKTDDSGYWHWQLYVWVNRKFKTQEARELIYGDKFKVNMYWRASTCLPATIKYCTKYESRFRGPWEFYPDFMGGIMIAPHRDYSSVVDSLETKLTIMDYLADINKRT